MKQVQENIENAVKMMKIKMKLLLQEDMKKDEIIEKLEKLDNDRKVNKDMISSLDKEFVIMKDILEKQSKQIENSSNILQDNKKSKIS